ncbi:prephenate dehydrogenase [Zavarzinella formosa]|uniref:prephenate dehydrogenase n=1 Tax=Zavarzinella formosa TaxID=360055 RepID=UPI0002EDFC55|nr:prephenate dehydrogenase/arogenate dehydrogenase family protein [Zavarzinella formosa]
MLFDTLAIVGVGLLGGSVGLAAKARGLSRHVVGIGRTPANLNRAKELGILDSFTTNLAEGVSSADIIVVCSPVDLIAAHVLEAAKAAKPGALLTDVGSTKGNIVRDVEAKLPPGVDFVGAHPLAGSEKQGAEFARVDLFDGRMCVLTPTANTKPAAKERATLFWQTIGSQVRTLSPEEHDLALATTSHLPHYIAALLARQLPEAWRPFAATGFRDTTRIAAGDPHLWTAIASENTLAISHALDVFAGQLETLREAVLNQNTAELGRLLTEAKRVRDALGS